MPGTEGKHPARHAKGKFWKMWKKIAENELQNIPCKNPFYLILLICLKHFVQGYT